MGWLPLSKGNNPDAAKEYDALYEGVLEWLASPVERWIGDVFSSALQVDLVHILDALYGMLRRPMPSTQHPIRDAVTKLANAASEGDLDGSMLWCGRPTSPRRVSSFESA